MTNNAFRDRFLRIDIVFKTRVFKTHTQNANTRVLEVLSPELRFGIEPIDDVIHHTPIPRLQRPWHGHVELKAQGLQCLSRVAAQVHIASKIAQEACK